MAVAVIILSSCWRYCVLGSGTFTLLQKWLLHQNTCSCDTIKANFVTTPCSALGIGNRQALANNDAAFLCFDTTYQITYKNVYNYHSDIRSVYGDVLLIALCGFNYNLMDAKGKSLRKQQKSLTLCQLACTFQTHPAISRRLKLWLSQDPEGLPHDTAS